MSLNFFGRGSGFSDEHNSAYFFTDDHEIVIIDCPALTIQKIKYIDLEDCQKLYVLITHTHGDHIGGLGLFVQYAHFVLNKPIIVVAPSKEVFEDLFMILKIEGNDSSWYELTTTASIANKTWFKGVIPTKHAPHLKGKCFGYNFNIDNTNIVYTGDTSILEPFIPYLTNGSVLYVDTSVYYGEVHLKLEDVLEDFLNLNKNGVKVYLMHLDDAMAAEEIVNDYPDIDVVEPI